MSVSRQTKIVFPVSKQTKSKKKLRKNKCISENDFDSENFKPNSAVKENLFNVCPSPEKKTKLVDENQQPGHSQKLSLGKNIFQTQETSVLQHAKYALHTSLPSRLIGRKNEMATISSFLQEHLSGKKPGSLYISGAPGTGKTSSLMHVLNNVENEFLSVFINCMTISNPAMVYKKIAAEIGLKSDVSSKTISKSLEKHVVTSEVMIVLVLDEIDHLDNKGQEVLYSLFQWPQLPNSTVILIGIANALDLTDRILPRLHTFNFNPTLMHFHPYSKDQIAAILEDRLSEIQDSGPVIKPMALQFCARKIAACTGDIRKALDVCRRAIEIMEKQAREQQTLKTSFDDRCNPGSPLKRLLQVKPVDLPQISAVLHEIYGSRVQAMQSISSHKKSEIMQLPLQQLLVLCTLIMIKKQVKHQDINLGKVYDVYRNICRKRQVADISEMEFHSLCTLVESRGFIELKKNKVARLTKVYLKVEEGEIEHLLEDKTLLSSILTDPSVVNIKK